MNVYKYSRAEEEALKKAQRLATRYFKRTMSKGSSPKDIVKFKKEAKS